MDSPPPKTEPMTGFSVDIRTSALPTGARLVTARAPGARLAAATLVFAAGSAHERRWERGAAHLLEHAVFRASGGRDGERIDREAEAAGTSLDAWTDVDRCAFEADLFPEGVGDAVALLGDMACRPRLDAADVAREIGVVRREIEEMGHDAPPPVRSCPRPRTAAAPGDAALQACWGEHHPLARSVSGTGVEVGRLNADRLRGFRDRAWRAGSAVLVLAGDIDHGAVAARAAEAFADLAPGTGLSAIPPPEFRRAWRLVAGHGAPASVDAVLPVGPRGVADLDDARALASLLGSGPSSRLSRALRDGMGIAYDTGAAVDAFVGGAAALRCWAGVSEAGIGAALDALSESLESLAAEGPKAWEVARLRSAARRALALDTETPYGLCAALADLFLETPHAPLPEGRFRRAVAAADPDRIRAAARAALDGPRTAVATAEGAWARRLSALRTTLREWVGPGAEELP